MFSEILHSTVLLSTIFHTLFLYLLFYVVIRIVIDVSMLFVFCSLVFFVSRRPLRSVPSCLFHHHCVFVLWQCQLSLWHSLIKIGQLTDPWCQFHMSCSLNHIGGNNFGILNKQKIISFWEYLLVHTPATYSIVIVIFFPLFLLYLQGLITENTLQMIRRQPFSLKRNWNLQK